MDLPFPQGHGEHGYEPEYAFAWMHAHAPRRELETWLDDTVVMIQHTDGDHDSVSSSPLAVPMPNAWRPAVTAATTTTTMASAPETGNNNHDSHDNHHRAVLWLSAPCSSMDVASSSSCASSPSSSSLTMATTVTTMLSSPSSSSSCASSSIFPASHHHLQPIIMPNGPSQAPSLPSVPMPLPQHPDLFQKHASPPKTGGEAILKPFACTACTWVFARKHDLERHTRKHTGKKPYACHACHSCFARSDARRRHIVTNPTCQQNPLNAPPRQRSTSSTNKPRQAA